MPPPATQPQAATPTTVPAADVGDMLRPALERLVDVSNEAEPTTEQ
jgi:hypothetical protein